jgi:hypothetical protein
LSALYRQSHARPVSHGSQRSFSGWSEQLSGPTGNHIAAFTGFVFFGSFEFFCLPEDAAISKALVVLGWVGVPFFAWCAYKLAPMSACNPFLNSGDEVLSATPSADTGVWMQVVGDDATERLVLLTKADRVAATIGTENSWPSLSMIQLN